MSSKQKIYVDSLPEDCVQIKTYNGKEYANLFFSPSTKKFYQAPEPGYRVLPFNERGYVRPMSLDGTSGTLSVSVVEKKMKDEIKSIQK